MSDHVRYIQCKCGEYFVPEEEGQCSKRTRAACDSWKARAEALEAQLASARIDRDKALAYSKKMWHDRGILRRERAEDKSLKRTTSKAVLRAQKAQAERDQARAEAVQLRAALPQVFTAITLYWSYVETRSAEAHAVYQAEAHRRGDVRHPDRYEDLSEATKEWDRVLVRWVHDSIVKLRDDTLETLSTSSGGDALGAVRMARARIHSDVCANECCSECSALTKAFPGISGK